MEKKVYDLQINDNLAHVMPPLQETELMLLRQSLFSEGCRDPLVVWEGTIVDGHNRYRICRENGIPFTFEDSRIDWSQWTEEEKQAHRTRDILMARGTIDGEMFAFFVCHLPSRLGGKGADLRPRGAEIAYNRAMELQKEFPGIKIVVMGDMNDNPTDVSMTKFLHADKENIEDVKGYD